MAERRQVRASSVSRALVILGDRWTWLILRAAFLGARRFQDWQAALGPSDPLLAERLRSLVENRVLKKVGRTDQRGGHEYQLTQCGLELWAPLVAIWAWETTWVAGRSEEAPQLVHTDCGARASPGLASGSCGAAVRARDVSQQAGPGAGWDEAPPPRHHRRSSQSDASSDRRLYVRETIAVIGDRWSALVLVACFAGHRRFTDFERGMHIPPYVLTQRLRTFQKVGVLTQSTVAGGGRSGSEYRLTAKGLALFSILMTLTRWADRWLAGPAGVPVELTHRVCDGQLLPELRCAHCDGVLQRRRIRFVDQDGRTTSVLRLPVPVQSGN